jgi:hypothetical protein
MEAANEFKVAIADCAVFVLFIAAFIIFISDV